MDPLYNNNPTPTPAPKPTPAPNAMPNIAIAGSAPAPNPAPAPAPAPAPEPVAPAPAAPTPAPVAPEPMFEPPMPPVPPMPLMQGPTEPTVPTPTMEEIPAASMSFENAFANSTTPIDSSAYGLDATEPVVQPGVEEVRDPVAEALAAPIKAADPVPGSIGSAFSVPPEAPESTLADMGASVPTTPVSNITFSDGPASAFQPDEGFVPHPPQKANANLKYILIGVGALLAIVLVIIIIMSMVPKGSSNNSGSNEQPEDQQVLTVDAKLSCKYTMKEADLLANYEAKSGEVVVEEEFNKNGMAGYDKQTTLEFTDADIADAVGSIMMDDAENEFLSYGLSADPFATSFASNSSTLIIKQSVTIDSANAANIEYYGIKAETTADKEKSKYEELGYTCTVE